MSDDKVEHGTAGAPAQDEVKDTDTTGPGEAEHSPSFWCIFIIIASTILLGSSTEFSGSGRGDYAIAVAVVGLGVSLIMLVWHKLIEGDNSPLRKPLLSLPLLGPINIEMLIATFLAVWYIVGASILTFEAPHQTPGNGYFSAWGGAFASVGYMAAASGRSMRAIGSSLLRGSGMLHALIVPSIVLIIAVTKEYCSLLACRSFLDTDRYYEEAALGLSVGIISLVFIIGLNLFFRYRDKLSGKPQQAAEWTPKVMALTLVGLWGTPPAWSSSLAPATTSAPTSVSYPTHNPLLKRLCTQHLPNFPTLSQSTAGSGCSPHADVTIPLSHNLLPGPPSYHMPT
jgi:hypothetical protein